MADTEHNRPKKSKAAIVLVVLLVVVAMAIVMLINLVSGGDTVDQTTGVPLNSQSESTTTSPDPVKSDTQNDDINPSSTGTAPGGNNSDLSGEAQ